MRPVIRATRRLVRRTGFDICRFPGKQFGHRRATVLSSRGVTVALDVGANRGQWVQELREWGYRGRVVSFEPGQEAFSHLEQAAAADPLWDARRVAVGDKPGEVTLNIAANWGASSSMLPMLDTHRDAAPEANYVATETVEQTTLAEVWSLIVQPEDRVYLKADVQGFERQVLDGAPDLAAVAAVELEISFTPLYRGGMLFDECFARMARAGFAIAHIDQSFHDPKTGALLQANGIFVRS